MITMKEIRETLYETEQHKNHINRIIPNNSTIYHKSSYGTETTERIAYGYNGKAGKSEK